MTNKKGTQFTVSAIFLTLTAVYVTCLLLSNLIAGKICSFFGISLPAAVILFPVTYILGDVLTEVYGYKKAKSVIWLGFGCSLFAVIIYMITIALPGASFFENQSAFAAVLGTTPRVALASFVGYLAGELINSMVLSRLKVMTKGKLLWVRTIASTVIGEFIDSFIFISISFFGTMSNSALFKMILFQYLFKTVYEIVFTPVTYAVVRWIKNKESVDTYDHGIKYTVI
ncbi:MAG: queuosine precursor transporter [Firmicutes bacterium]|nr:queuosine precursor transporter [Bacillota bacterium]